jgi:hypothetical protein
MVAKFALQSSHYVLLSKCDNKMDKYMDRPPSDELKNYILGFHDTQEISVLSGKSSNPYCWSRGVPIEGGGVPWRARL